MRSPINPPDNVKAMAVPAPKPAYIANPGSALHADRELYSSIAQTASVPGARELVENLIVPERSGKAFVVKAGNVCRITTPKGPQVGDLNIWNLHNSRERFWASRTRQLHASHVTTFDRLWSTLPYLRPLVTITGDSLSAYGVDEHGARCHDLLGTRCDPYVNKMLTGDDYDYHCHSNLTRAILPYGLSEDQVHDVLNVFQVTGLNEEGKYFMKTCPANPEDYFEFFAEIDILCALSTCPGGDLSAWGWAEGEGNSMLECCRPLGIEIYKLTDPSILAEWKSPECPQYRGHHGMTIPLGENDRKT